MAHLNKLLFRKGFFTFFTDLHYTSALDLTSCSDLFCVYVSEISVNKGYFIYYNV